MSQLPPPQQPPPNSLAGRRRSRRWLALLALGLLTYFVATYLAIPALWKRYSHRHPALDDVPGITTTGSGIPGDPINLGLVGDKKQLVRDMLAIGWHPADPLSLKSCLEIAEATVLKRPYEDAPVSNLYLFGRKEDLAFEQQVGPDPRERHHVRFWKSDQVDDNGRPLWFGSATFDKSVGFSHTTGQITHHIGPDVDAERDRLIEQLRNAGLTTRVDIVDGFHKTLSGKNGGGDPWYTDGRLFIAILTATPP